MATNSLGLVVVGLAAVAIAGAALGTSPGSTGSSPGSTGSSPGSTGSSAWLGRWYVLMSGHALDVTSVTNGTVYYKDVTAGTTGSISVELWQQNITSGNIYGHEL